MVIRYSSDRTVDTGATVIYASAEDSRCPEGFLGQPGPEAVEAVAAEQADESNPPIRLDSTVAEADPGPTKRRPTKRRPTEAQVEVEAVDAPETETPRPSRRGRLFRQRR